MKRFRLTLLLGLTTPLLAGCPVYTTSMPGYYDTGVAYGGPKNDRTGVYTMDGPTLYDALHQVNQYLTRYPGAQLVRVSALSVGANARVAKTSAWEFVYRVKVRDTVGPAPAPSAIPLPVPTSSPAPVPTPSPTASPDETGSKDGPGNNGNDGNTDNNGNTGKDGKGDKVRALDVVSDFSSRLLTFRFTGEGQLLAPREADDYSDSTLGIDINRAIYLNKAIETCLDIGMGMGRAGVEVSLYPTSRGGAVYSIDSSVATRNTLHHLEPLPTPTPFFLDCPVGVDHDDEEYEPMPTPRPRWTPRAKPTPTPAPEERLYRGKYLIDAYTGAIIERPTRL